MNIEEKFWKYVDKRSESECWNWIGPSSGNGYGQLRFNLKAYRSNRLSYMIHFGDIPEGMYICHSCDNPMCVNPNHLFLGTPSDNARDRNRKGRAAPMDGENNSNNRFSKEEILEMRALFLSGKSCKQISRKFNTSQEYVRNVIKRKVWKDL